jgi:hypothetical protein
LRLQAAGLKLFIVFINDLVCQLCIGCSLSLCNNGTMLCILTRRGQRGRRRHNNQMKEEAAFGCLRHFPTCKVLVAGHLQDAGNGASAGLWGCIIVGAATGVHPWGACGSASLLEGRPRRLPTRGWRRWRHHVSGTMVGALLGWRAVAVHRWVGSGVKRQSTGVGERKTTRTIGW